MTTSNHLLRTFRVIAILEGLSYLMLGITMYLKYELQMPKPNYVVGAIHGGLFIAYCALLVWLFFRDKWKFSEGFYSFIASLIPFGTFIAEKKIFSRK